MRALGLLARSKIRSLAPSVAKQKRDNADRKWQSLDVRAPV